MVSFEYDVLASISRRQTSFTLISIKEYISSTLGLSWPLAGLSIGENVVSVSIVCEPSFSDAMASRIRCTRVHLLKTKTCLNFCNLDGDTSKRSPKKRFCFLS